MSGPKDAVGQPLIVGDHVVHVSRHGSSVSLTRREIIEISAVTAMHPNHRWLIRLAPLSKHMSPPVRPYNLIKIAKETA